MTAAARERTGEPLVLAIETATSRALVALGTLAGELRAVDEWDAGHRHAEELLVRIAALLAGAGLGRPRPGALAGIVAGTGPGGFTGLRVGLATAHGIARAAAAPLVGIPTGVALDAAARTAGAVPPGVGIALALPAGPAALYLVRDGRATLARSDELVDDPASGLALVAVDLAGRAPEEATARGAAARAGLAAALLRLGAARLRAGVDDGGAVAPEYVTMPRGVAVGAGEVAWSPGRP